MVNRTTLLPGMGSDVRWIWFPMNGVFPWPSPSPGLAASRALPSQGPRGFLLYGHSRKAGHGVRGREGTQLRSAVDCRKLKPQLAARAQVFRFALSMFSLSLPFCRLFLSTRLKTSSLKCTQMHSSDCNAALQILQVMYAACVLSVYKTGG